MQKLQVQQMLYLQQQLQLMEAHIQETTHTQFLLVLMTKLFLKAKVPLQVLL